MTDKAKLDSTTGANQYQYFNDPSWMNFDGPCEKSAVQRKLSTADAPQPPGTEPVISRSSTQGVPPPFTGASVRQNIIPVRRDFFTKSIVEDSPLHSSKSVQMTSSSRSYPPRGYRRGNTISSYHLPSPSCPRYNTNSRYDCRGQGGDWGSIHLPNCEDNSQSEFYQSSLSSRGRWNPQYPYQNDRREYNNNSYPPCAQSNPTNNHNSSWISTDRRTNLRNMPYKIYSSGPVKENCTKTLTAKQGTLNTGKVTDTLPEGSRKSEDVQNLIVKLSESNKRSVLEKCNGNTNVLQNKNNIVVETMPIVYNNHEIITQTIPLLLNTKRRYPPVTTNTVPAAIQNDVPIEIEDEEPSSATILANTVKQRTDVNKNVIDTADFYSENSIIDLDKLLELDMPFSPRNSLEIPKNNVKSRMNIQMSPLDISKNVAVPKSLSINEIPPNNCKDKLEIGMQYRLSTPINGCTSLKSPLEVVFSESNDNVEVVIPSIYLDEIGTELDLQNVDVDVESFKSNDSIEDKLRQLTADYQDATEGNDSSTALQQIKVANVASKKRKRTSSTLEKSTSSKQVTSLNRDTLNIKEILKNTPSVDDECNSKKRRLSGHSDSKKMKNTVEKGKRTHEKEMKQYNKKRLDWNQKFAGDRMEAKSTNIEKRSHSSVKVDTNTKRRQSCETKVVKANSSNKKQVQRRNSLGGDNSSTISCILQKMFCTNLRTDSAVIQEVACAIPDPALRNIERSIVVPSPDIQSTVNDRDGRIDADICSRGKDMSVFDFNETLLCDNECDGIITRKLAKISNRLRETQSASIKERSKSANYHVEKSSPSPQKAAKMTTRRRTINDALDLKTLSEKAIRGRQRSRRSSVCHDKYADDPDYKTNYTRPDTSRRITRSKSRELMQIASFDVLNSNVPEDIDFYEQTTPPATPRTPPRPQNKTPEILRSLHMKSNDATCTTNRLGLEKDEMSHNINHVYAPSLFNQYDFGGRFNDPRLNRPPTEPTPEQKENNNVNVDEITLQNTMANKVTALEEEIQDNAIVTVPDETISQTQLTSLEEASQLNQSLCKDATLKLELYKLTDKDIHNMKKELCRGKSKTSKDGSWARQLETTTTYLPQEKNKIPCSIAKTVIAKSILCESDKDNCNTVSILDDIMQQMDAHMPRAIVNNVPKIRKSVDRFGLDNILPVDNAITKPLSNKPLKQIIAQKSFNTFATVSTESDEPNPPIQPTKREIKQTRLERLFGAKARQIAPIYKIPRIDQQKSMKNNKVAADKLLKKKTIVKDDVFHVRCHTLGIIEEFVEETTNCMPDFRLDLAHARSVEFVPHLVQALCTPAVKGCTFLEIKKSIPEVGDSPIINFDDLFDDDDVNNLRINGEPPEISIENLTKPSTLTSLPKMYCRPTIVATVDLLDKWEEEETTYGHVVPGVPPLDSILIVPVQEYVANVISTIGQYVQMERLHPRLRDLVKKTTSSFTLETMPCDAFVDDFRTAYLLQLGKKFVKYTDSIVIQNFSVALLYTSLTQANLQYNGFKIKKLDVANAICDLYQAVGSENMRSVFCKQLYQLSLHMKEMEMSAEIELMDILNRQSTPVQNIPPASETNNLSAPSDVHSMVTSNNQATSSASTDLSGTTTPEILSSITGSIISVSNASNTVSGAQESLAPVMQTCQPQPQSVASTPPLQEEPPASLQEINNFTNIISSAAPPHTTAPVSSFVLQQAVSAEILSTHEPDLCQIVVANEGSKVVKPQSKRRIKVTPTLQQQKQQQQQQVAVAQQTQNPREGSEQRPNTLLFTNEMKNLLLEQCRLYNLLRSQNCRPMETEIPPAITDAVLHSFSTINTINNSGSLTLVQPPQASNNGFRQCEAAQSLRNFRMDWSNMSHIQTSAYTAATSSKIVPVASDVSANPKISVRNIDQLLHQPATRQRAAPLNSRRQQKTPRNSKINSPVSQMPLPPHPRQNQAQVECSTSVPPLGGKNILTSPAARSASNVSVAEESAQATDGVTRTSSRESSGFFDDSRDSTDFNCVCGKAADMICSCKLIVYCSQICQGKDWNRHIADHVEP